jgi:hypothetical protein
VSNLTSLRSDAPGEQVSSGERTALTGRRAQTGIRIGGHALVWTVVLVPTIIQLARGWFPGGDDGEVTARSFEVLTHSPPLVGMVTVAFPHSPTQPHDLGPLLFWLLALPVHIDLAHGALWGAAIACGAALSVAWEASLRSRLWGASVVIVAIVVDLAWRVPSIFFNPEWNPYFGLVFLSASVVLACVVASGDLRWWPVLVGFGSVAAQCHLALLAPAALVVLGSVVVGSTIGRSRWRELVGDRARPSRWWLWGVVVGAVCWAPTIIQQLTGHPGNLTVLWQAKRDQASLGAGFALRSMATTVSPSPVWLRHPGGLPDFPSPRSAEAVIDGHSPVIGGVALVLLVLVVVVAVRAKRRNLAGFAAVTMCLSVGILFSFAAYPPGGGFNSAPLGYLTPVLMLAGVLWWFTGLWVVRDLAMAGWTEWASRHGRPSPDFAAMLRPHGRQRSFGVLGAAVVVIAVVAFTVVPSVAHPPRLAPVYTGQTAEVTKYVESHFPLGTPIELVVPRRERSAIDQVSLALYLMSHGWRTAISNQAGRYADGLSVSANAHWHLVYVRTNHNNEWMCAFHKLHCSSVVSVSTIGFSLR